MAKSSSFTVVDPDCEPSELGASCANPIFSEICNLDEIPLGIEASLAPVGCVTDASGAITGKVFLCKVVDEETGIATFEKRLENVDGTFVQPYTGIWGDCVTDCPPSAALGVLVAWG